MFWRKKPAPPPEPPEFGDSIPSDYDDGGDAPTTEFLTGDSNVDRRSVEVLLEAIARVSESRDLETLLIDIVDRSVEITGAERGMLILEAEPGEYRVRVARSQGHRSITEEEEPLRFSTSVVKRVLTEGQAVRATVQSDSDALELGRSVYDLKLRAVMCVPIAHQQDDASGEGLPAERSARGVLYVDSRVATREYDRRDLGLFAALSHHISIALEKARLNLDSIEKTRLEHSLELASAIQSGLMPRIPSDLEGFDLHGWYKPAERTSGDFFDFVRTRDQRLAVIIGDVTGHGIGPALVTAMAQASLRSYLKVVPDAPAAMTMLNQDLSERLDDGMFVTLLLALLAPDGGIEWINAGHSTPVVWRRDGQVEPYPEHGVALGMIDEAEYSIHGRLVMEVGDVLVTYTDGLIEAHHPDRPDELFGEERLHRHIAECAAGGAGAEEITRSLAEAALSFAGGEHDDDITLVVVRRT